MSEAIEEFTALFTCEEALAWARRPYVPGYGGVYHLWLRPAEAASVAKLLAGWGWYSFERVERIDATGELGVHLLHPGRAARATRWLAAQPVAA